MARYRSLLLGVVFCVFVVGFYWTGNGMHYVFGRSFTSDSQGALFFWLAQGMLLTPACFLIGHGLSALCAGRLEAWWSSLEGASAQAQRALWGALAVIGAVGAWLGNRVLLRGFPITDDELHVRYGGQLLAQGELSGPLWAPTSLQPPRFLVQLADQSWASFDWLGVQLAWALAEVTQTENLIFALHVGLTVVGVGVASSQLQRSWRWGLVAVALLACSPMFVAMSLTTHAHVLSRAGIAAALACLLLARGGHLAWALAGGLCVGLAGITRPVEVAFILGPWLLALAWDGVREQGRARAVALLVVLGALVPVAMTALHNLAITDNVLIFPRFSPLAVSDGFPPQSFMYRLGANAGYNLLMLAIWFGGLPGLALFLLGSEVSREARLLSAGVGAILLVGLTHDVTGINLFGPIHYTECVVPMALVAGAGARRVVAWARARGVAVWELAATVGVAVLVLNTSFNLHNCWQYDRQARVHAYVFETVRGQALARGAPGAIIFSPRYFDVWRAIPAAKSVGAYVYDWPRPAPDGRDELVYMLPPGNSLEMEQIMARWPNHAPLFLQVLPAAPWIRLVPFAEVVAPREGGRAP